MIKSRILAKAILSCVASVLIVSCTSEDNDSNGKVCRTASSCKEFALSHLSEFQSLVRKLDSGSVISAYAVGNATVSISSYCIPDSSEADSSKVYSFYEGLYSSNSSESIFYIVNRSVAPNIPNDSVYVDLDKSYNEILPYGTGYEKITDGWYIAAESPNQN